MEESRPTISVVICTYNRDKYIRAALESLDRQTLEKKYFEVLIINNNSTDHTAEICQDFIGQSTATNFYYFFEPEKGLSAARNRGLKESRGEIITYMDDDAVAAENFLAALFRFFTHEPDAVGAGGKVLPRYAESPEPAWMNKYLYGFVAGQDFGDEQKKYTPRMKYPAGCNMSYKKEVLLQVNGFNNALQFRSDDKLINYRVKKISDNIWYLPEAVVFHHIDKDRLAFSSFKKLYQKTGNEEKKRIESEGSFFSWLAKFAGYSARLGASVGIWISFLLQGKEIKGRYVFFSQWFTFLGFLKKDVFVR